MTDADDNIRLIAELRQQIAEQHAQITDLTRHNKELRQAVDALLQPAPSELFAVPKPPKFGPSIAFDFWLHG